jgi:hypothetical protein
MKHSLIRLVYILMVLFLANLHLCAGEIDSSRYYSSHTFPSPDGIRLIIVDYFNTEAGPNPEHAILYSLPMDSNKHREIAVANHYEWSEDSQWFVTQKWGTDWTVNKKHYPVLQTKIVVYDKNGIEQESPGYGTSPGFLHFPDQFVYYSEFSDDGELIPPTIISYNISTKIKTVLYQFEDKYTFWPEQIDIYYPPHCPVYRGGIRGLLHLKSNLEEVYTFVISGDKLISLAKAANDDLLELY